MHSSFLPAVSAAFLMGFVGTAFASHAGSTAANPEKKICKSYPPPTGTRLGPRRICATQEQWDEMQKEGAKYLFRRQVQQNGFVRRDNAPAAPPPEPARH